MASPEDIQCVYIATELLTEWVVVTASLVMCLVHKVWWTSCCVETEHELEHMLLT